MQLTIDTSLIVALAQLWQRAPEIVNEEVLVFVTDSDLLIQGELQQSLPRGAGGLSGGAGLAGSVFAEEQVSSSGVIGMVATNLGYAEPVELGSRPHMPPVQPIADWVAAKLGIAGKAGERVAWAIAKKIEKVGTKPDLTWSKVHQRVLPEIQRKLGDAINRILDRLVTA